MTDVLVLQHIEIETIGTIAQALQAGGFLPRVVHAYAEEPIPHDLSSAAGLIIMGGPMGVYDSARYPFLDAEQRLIAKAIEANKPILGICLGSQLLAATLGAEVRKGAQKEIGWHRLSLTPEAAADPLWQSIPPTFMAFHWHGDVFDLPQGAVPLASSALTPHQAFRYGDKAYGFLFHMEVNETMIQDMVRTFSEEVQEAGGDANQILAETAQHLAPLHTIGHQVFSRWVALLKP
ncbi:MAG TPA: gamma-glutamyl-gamma-aminobutyrate hydrolase family protein [Chthonomonas sp.]|jgi:GMP synthase (glutamine-hydrolysing)|uniref:type 1 glutamine amidotransferase n=1 Tax=Chthonomonas sp. TaxID=2282153 RepID=UPI002B4AF0EF|nr:gamma-glutamyl-gamma-aminobutyrate hydrolase family protein [Chthonomonas sp.]HLH79304.1 gamma-glutamyl-gamma-aminobutyrate hydrolase family protein [Chthonomonas sp.]